MKTWDKPGFSPYFTQWKPGKPGFVPGTNPVCPWDNPGDEGRHRKFMRIKVYVPFSLAMIWLTPADIEFFLRPTDEESDALWKKAINYVAVLHSAYPHEALLGCARISKVSNMNEETDRSQSLSIRNSCEGLYLDPDNQEYYAEAWDRMRFRSEIKQGPLLSGMSHSSIRS